MKKRKKKKRPSKYYVDRFCCVRFAVLYTDSRPPGWLSFLSSCLELSLALVSYGSCGWSEALGGQPLLVSYSASPMRLPGLPPVSSEDSLLSEARLA